MTIRRVGTNRRRVTHADVRQPLLVLAATDDELDRDDRAAGDPWAWTWRDLQRTPVGAVR